MESNVRLSIKKDFKLVVFLNTDHIAYCYISISK